MEVLIIFNKKLKKLTAFLMVSCLFLQTSTQAHSYSFISDFEQESTLDLAPQIVYNQSFDDEINQDEISIKKLLKTALQPVGKTMYIWGGGWNKEDTGSGVEAVSIGLSNRWLEFTKKQNKGYNYKKTRLQIHDGLDCSGYVGWVIYNLLNTENGKTGYVMLAEKMAKKFADMGFGKYTPAKSVQDFKAGDIMSNKKHVYIVLGSCNDGSVVLVHSSPPGVQINGTVSKDGNKDSQAHRLAQHYMKTYYPQWYEKYPPKALEKHYLTSYSQMRWDIENDKFLYDDEQLSQMNAQEVLKILFQEV